MLRPATEREWSFSYKKSFLRTLRKTRSWTTCILIAGRFFFGLLNVLNSPPQHRDHYNFIHTLATRCSVDFRGESEEGGKVESVAKLFFQPVYFLIVCSAQKNEKLMQEIITKSAVGGATVFLCYIHIIRWKLCGLNGVGQSSRRCGGLFDCCWDWCWSFWELFSSLFSVWFTEEGGGKIDDEKLVEELRALTQKQQKMRPIQSLTVAEGWERSTLPTDCGFFWILCVNLNNDGKKCAFLFLCVRLFCTSLRILSRFFLSYLMFSFWAETQENLRFQNHIVCRRDNIIKKFKKNVVLCFMLNKNSNRVDNQVQTDNGLATISSVLTHFSSKYFSLHFGIACSDDSNVPGPPKLLTAPKLFTPTSHFFDWFP